MLIDSFCQVTIDQLSELMILATTHHLAELSRPFFSICWIVGSYLENDIITWLKAIYNWYSFYRDVKVLSILIDQYR